jgi:hypothetical protein
VFLSVLTGVMMAATVAGAQSYKGNELPPYEVAQSDGAFELRIYGAHLVAEVTVTGNQDAAVNAGFRKLAGYIFGGNDGGDKIAMTVPVAQTAVGAAEWTVRFMMPAAYDLASLPAPRDASIRFVEIAPERQVTVQFSGIRDDAKLMAKTQELRAWAALQGLTITEGPHYYFYDSPFTLPWNRRNEVAFRVE